MNLCVKLQFEELENINFQILFPFQIHKLSSRIQKVECTQYHWIIQSDIVSGNRQ